MPRLPHSVAYGESRQTVKCYPQKKCEKYWPSYQQPRVKERYTVELTSERDSLAFVRREFLLTFMSGSNERVRMKLDALRRLLADVVTETAQDFSDVCDLYIWH